jgi:hypothetical protein
MIERLRPWWEVHQDKMAALREQLFNLRVTFGHAAVASPTLVSGVPMSTVLVDDAGETGALANIVLLSVQARSLHMRFRLPGAVIETGRELELVLVPDAHARALVAGEARSVTPGEFRAEIELPPDLAEEWASIKATDRVPFGLILLAKTSDE